MHTGNEELRETFGSRFGTLMTMIGVAVGLGNIWRFPYMVGRFGGAAFVLFYLLVVLAIGVPALMAEWALGRHTRRGPVGAFAAGGLPYGKQIGWFFFFVVTTAMGYYTAVIGWVLFHAVAEAAALVGGNVNASSVLPPDTGFSATSLALQLLCTGIVVATCALVVQRGLRAGIEKVSKVIIPVLFVTLLLLVVRSVTLPGAEEGIRWYILKFSLADIDPKVVVAAMGQVFFSMSLGGTFMVVYGSYLGARDPLASNAIWTVSGDTLAGLLAGFVIFPAVFALGLEPSSGPALLFSTLPQVFDGMPLGGLFGLLFFGSLCAAAYLSDVAALEVLAAALTDNTRIHRRKAVWVMSAAVFLLSIPPSINMAVFVPWDLIFGSGMQILGSLFAVLTLTWCVKRSAALKELTGRDDAGAPVWLYYWVRFGIPAIIAGLGVWWLLTSVFGTVSGV